MPVGHIDDVSGVALEGDDLRGVLKKLLVGPEQGWDGWAMRVFEVAPGGHTPRHSHDWPHINLVLDGDGLVLLDGREHALRAGSFAFIPAAATHQFRNSGTAVLSFVCIVPYEGEFPVGENR